MKKPTILLSICLLGCHWLAGQCPTNISFSTQGQVDSFQINHPGCTVIPGNVKISGSGIGNLQGLNSLQVVEGKFEMLATNLASLQGLNQLDSILGGFKILDNQNLLNLNGLDSLAHIGTSFQSAGIFGFLYGLWVGNNPALTACSGLNSLKTTNRLRFSENQALTSLNGLENLQSIEGDIFLHYTFLTSLHGLENLKSVGGYLNLARNDSLSTLSGLENLQLLGGLRVEGTNSLDSIDKLDKLQSLGWLQIQDNQSLTTLNGLEKIDSLPAGLSISKTVLTTLSGLENIQSTGDIYIASNDVLVNLDGLGKIDSVHGSLEMYGNSALTSLNGLENLVYVGHGLDIRFTALASLNGLLNLKSIGSYLSSIGNSVRLHIGYNSDLTSLMGLENADFSTLTQLDISYNHKLALCNIPPVCLYFQNGGGLDNIYENDPGCNSEAEIIAACAVPTHEFFSEKIKLSPNPAGDFLKIELPENVNAALLDLRVFDAAGRSVRFVNFSKVDKSQTLDLQGLAPGLYWLKAVAGERVFAGRFVKI